MHEDLKLYAKITGKALLKWALVVTSGLTLTIVFFFFILFQNSAGAGGGHGSALAFVINLAAGNPCGFVLFAGAPVFTFLYFMVANKITIQSVIYDMWSKKASGFVEPTIKKIADRLTSKQNWINDVSNEALLRARLLDANKNEKTTSKTNKKVTNYILKKIRLDDIDFGNEKLSFANIISDKLKNYISEATKPSFLFFWLLFLLQIALFTCAQIFS